MAAIVGDKIKLTNYGYVLEPKEFSSLNYISNDENIINDSWQISYKGTRPFHQKLIDAFDIDWRPYGVTLANGENFTFENTSDIVSCLKNAMSNYKLASSGKFETGLESFYRTYDINNIWYDNVNQKISYTYLTRVGNSIELLNNTYTEVFNGVAPYLFQTLQNNHYIRVSNGLPSNITYSSYISSEGNSNNITYAYYSTLVGYGLETNYSSYSATFGKNSKTTNSHYGLVSGYNNETKDSYCTTVSGWNNYVNASYATIVSGHSNSTTRLTYGISVGINNTIQYSEKSIFCGEENNIQSTTRSIVTALQTRTTNTNQSIIGAVTSRFVNNTQVLSTGNRVSAYFSRNAIVGGNASYAYYTYSAISFGEGVNTYNTYENAIGKWNVRYPNGTNHPTFAIGIGSDDANRKNGFEVWDNGDVIINNLNVGNLKVDDLSATLLSGPNMSFVTYDELKTLVDNAELLPGRFYTITNYKFVPASGASVSSTNIEYKIVVPAISTSELSTNGWLIDNDNNVYEIRYNINNDTSLYNWANSTSGRGVIYWMKDKFNNEAPHDFLNILYTIKLDSDGYYSTSGTERLCYTFNVWDSTNEISKCVMTQFDNCVIYNNDLFTGRGNWQELNTSLILCGGSQVTCNKISHEGNIISAISLLTQLNVIGQNNIIYRCSYSDINGNNNIINPTRMITAYIEIEKGANGNTIQSMSSKDFYSIKLTSGVTNQTINITESNQDYQTIYRSSKSKEILL